VVAFEVLLMAEEVDLTEEAFDDVLTLVLLDAAFVVVVLTAFEVVVVTFLVEEEPA
jgi:hypothetical protein